MASVKPTPASSEDIADTLAAYGIITPADAAAVTAKPGGADPVADTLAAYGVTLKPDATPAAAQAKTAPQSSTLQTTRGGKIIEPAEAPPSAKDIKAGQDRGLRAQTIGAMPIVGPAIDMATAAIPIAGKASTFEQRLYDQRQADRAFAVENPWTSAGAQVAGSLLGYGGIGKLAPALMGELTRVTPTLGARIWGGTAGGGSINALDAGMRGEDPITAAEIGAAGGFLGPVASRGIEGVVGNAANYLWPRPGPLKQVPRSGINLLTNALGDETPASLAAAKGRMGPAGFLADINPATTDVAGAIADIPGPGKALVRQAYAERADAQGDRIEGALTRAMGPRVNVVDQTHLLTEERAKAADPLYEKFRTMQVHPTDEIKALIPRLEKAGAFDMAEELSGISGKPINRAFFTTGPQKEYPTAESWDYVKRGLDRRIDQAYSSGDKTLAGKLLGLKGDLINEVEKTPAGKVWKQARSEFADRSALIDQLGAGRDTFVGGRSGTSVDEFREEITHLKGPELMARIQGARDIASEAMGASKNGDTALRNKLLAPNNQEKLKLLLGDADGRALIKTLKEEEYLGNQTANVLGNLQTGASGSMRSERKKMFDPPQLPSWFENIDLAKPASWIPPAVRPHNVLQGIANENAGRAAPALAPLMITQQGPQLDAVVNALRSEAERISNVNRIAAPWANRAGALISGPGQAFYRRSQEQQR